MSLFHAWTEERWAESPTIFFHSVAWSAQETAGLSAPCVPVVSACILPRGRLPVLRYNESISSHSGRVFQHSTSFVQQFEIIKGID